MEQGTGTDRGQHVDMGSRDMSSRVGNRLRVRTYWADARVARYHQHKSQEAREVADIGVQFLLKNKQKKKEYRRRHQGQKPRAKASGGHRQGRGVGSAARHVDVELINPGLCLGGGARRVAEKAEDVLRLLLSDGNDRLAAGQGRCNPVIG